MIYRVPSAGGEGGARVCSGSTQEFVGPGRLRALRLVDVELADGGFRPVEGTQREIPCELFLLAMGFTGPERGPLLTGLGVEFDATGNVASDDAYATSGPGRFPACDLRRRQSLSVS